MCSGASPRTAEQKPDLTADWELNTRKSCWLHQGTGGVRGWGSRGVRVSGYEAVGWARLASGDWNLPGSGAQESHTAGLNVYGEASGYLCHEPPFLLETWAQGTQPCTESPRRVKSLPDLGKPSCTEANGAAFLCPPVGWAETPGAQKQEEWSGPQKPSPALSLPELQSLFIILPHRNHSQGQARLPDS